MGVNWTWHMKGHERIVSSNTPHSENTFSPCVWVNCGLCERHSRSSALLPHASVCVIFILCGGGRRVAQRSVCVSARQRGSSQRSH
jgi:hypothetical protein